MKKLLSLIFAGLGMLYGTSGRGEVMCCAPNTQCGDVCCPTRGCNTNRTSCATEPCASGQIDDNGQCVPCSAQGESWGAHNGECVDCSTLGEGWGSDNDACVECSTKGPEWVVGNDGACKMDCSRLDTAQGGVKGHYGIDNGECVNCREKYGWDSWGVDSQGDGGCIECSTKGLGWHSDSGICKMDCAGIGRVQEGDICVDCRDKGPTWIKVGSACFDCSTKGPSWVAENGEYVDCTTKGIAWGADNGVCAKDCSRLDTDEEHYGDDNGECVVCATNGPEWVVDNGSCKKECSRLGYSYVEENGACVDCTTKGIGWGADSVGYKCEFCLGKGPAWKVGDGGRCYHDCSILGPSYIKGVNGNCVNCADEGTGIGSYNGQCVDCASIDGDYGYIEINGQCIECGSREAQGWGWENGLYAHEECFYCPSKGAGWGMDSESSFACVKCSDVGKELENGICVKHEE